MLLSSEEKRQLLQIARRSIELHLKGEMAELVEGLDGTLCENCGAFVTLKKGEQLRGCIGVIEGFKPLHETVVEMAVAAATRDSRFPSVELSEMDEIHIEISALSPITPVEDAAEIEIGKHGLIINRGFNRGLLLPQVAAEYDWDVDTFLSMTCRKAGLAENSWKLSDTRIEKFSAVVFGEEQ